jgi:hypothetical protein
VRLIKPFAALDLEKLKKIWPKEKHTKD